MIYSQPAESLPVDQGDVIDGCPIAVSESLVVFDASPAGFVTRFSRVYVLTQACDLMQGKVSQIVVAPVLNANDLVARGYASPL
jgi:hypothetical protein